MAAASTESCPETKISLPESDNEDDHKRVQLIQRSQWLRAAILGANDGLLSTTSLMLGIGAAKDGNHSLMIMSGVAGALAGACSMAVGEFVSVSTQRDIQQTAVEKNDDGGGKPHKESKTIDHQSELAIPRIRESVVSPPATHDHTFSPARSPFMKVVARDRCADDDETLKEEEWLPNPYEAAGASGLAFLCGSLVPLLTAKVLTQETVRVVGIVIVASLALAVFGGASARLGGSPVRVSAARVVIGGWIAMAITYGLLKPFDRD